MNPAYRPRPIRLAFSALFWRLFLGFVLFFALLVALMIGKRVPPAQVPFAFLFLMLPFLATSFAIAALLTLVVNFAVNLIVRPRLVRWLSPKSEEGHAAFHLEPREREVASASTRMAVGKAWPPGCLVLTDRRLMFLPNAWDIEPWSLKFDRLRWAAPVPAPRPFGGLVQDIPPRLVIAATGDENRHFAMLDAPAWANLLAPCCQAVPPDHSEPLRR